MQPNSHAHHKQVRIITLLHNPKQTTSISHPKQIPKSDILGANPLEQCTLVISYDALQIVGGFKSSWDNSKCCKYLPSVYKH